MIEKRRGGWSFEVFNILITLHDEKKSNIPREFPL
jgi:hypothetical protein